MTKRINIAIDGYSGCGKSSTAKALAEKLGYIYIDTGAMYRAVTLYFLDNHIDIHNEVAIEDALKNIHLAFDKKNPIHSNLMMNEIDVEKEIRSKRVAEFVSPVSTIPSVRKAMVAQQKEMGKEKGVVMDGRDIGTVVFPEAELKIFMTADASVRAGRRKKELLGKGLIECEDEIKQNLITRDHIDSSRKDSPLRKADGAMEIDTTHLTLADQIEIVYQASQLVIGK